MRENSTFSEDYIKILNYLEKAGDEGATLRENFDMSKRVFSRHIANLKKAGFKITKKKNLYYYDNYFNSLSLDDVEKSLLAHILVLAEKYLSKKTNQTINSLVKRISRLSSRQNYNEILERFTNYLQIEFFELYGERIKILQTYIEKKEGLRVTLRSKRTIDFYPLELIWKNNSLFVLYEEDEKKKTLAIEKIIKFAQLNAKKDQKRNNEVYYELYGRLIKSYLLKPKERLVDSFKDRIVIANGEKNKNMLFKRLLRYDTLCRVILPNTDVENFKKLITNAIDNISALSFE